MTVSGTISLKLDTVSNSVIGPKKPTNYFNNKNKKKKIKNQKTKKKTEIESGYKSVRDITSVERGRGSSNSRKRSLKLEPPQIRCREAQPPLPSKPTHSLSYTHTHIHTYIHISYIHKYARTWRDEEEKRAEKGGDCKESDMLVWGGDGDWGWEWYHLHFSLFFIYKGRHFYMSHLLLQF
jgi:hypothetical protein